MIRSALLASLVVIACKSEDPAAQALQVQHLVNAALDAHSDARRAPDAAPRRSDAAPRSDAGQSMQPQPQPQAHPVGRLSAAEESEYAKLNKRVQAEAEAWQEKNPALKARRAFFARIATAHNRSVECCAHLEISEARKRSCIEEKKLWGVAGDGLTIVVVSP